jgi:hypothetical protein
MGGKILPSRSCRTKLSVHFYWFYWPVPVRATFCGLLLALSASLKLAFSAPAVVGAKVTLMTQLAPGFSVAGAVPQVVLDTENCVAFAPVMLHERLMSAPVPVLATVTPRV